MWGMFYQIIKDLFQGADHRAIAGFSAKQIDRTIKQIDLAAQLEVKRLKAAAEKEKSSALIRGEAASKPGFGFSMNALEMGGAIDEEIAARIQQVEAEALYAKDILIIEKEKLGFAEGDAVDSGHEVPSSRRVRCADPTDRKILTPALSQGERELEKKKHCLSYG